jgi:hypothetical protein
VCTEICNRTLLHSFFGRSRLQISVRTPVIRTFSVFYFQFVLERRGTVPWLRRLRWSRGSVLVFGTQVRGSDSSGEKILSTPSFGGEVKPPVPCRALRHVKEPKSDLKVVTFDKILGHFSPVVPPSAAGFASVASDAGGLLWRKLERSKSLVLLQVGSLTCRWQRHSLKPSC